MLNIHTMTLGAYQTNCYIIHDVSANTCAIIDPGYEPAVILDKVCSLGLTVDAILLTHGHFDHVGGVKALAEQTGCRVYLCPEDLSMPHQMTAGPLHYTHTYTEGNVLMLAGLTVRVLHTPGHTPGSVCLAVEDTLFTGDTLFQDSCGRTDLPGGDWAAIVQSLKRLKALEADYKVCPGHGPATTLAQEKKYNPYMR